MITTRISKSADCFCSDLITFLQDSMKNKKITDSS